jgi:hypothetical protein
VGRKEASPAIGQGKVKPSLPKRFYQDVAVKDDGAGAAPLLDGKKVRTPAKAQLVLPTRALAEAVAEEWRAQGERIDPVTMPLTKLANSAIDGVVGREQAVIDDIAAHAGSDLLCYRAQAPDGLVAAQRKHWDPVLAWAGGQDIVAAALVTPTLTAMAGSCATGTGTPGTVTTVPLFGFSTAGATAVTSAMAALSPPAFIQHTTGVKFTMTATRTTHTPTPADIAETPPRAPVTRCLGVQPRAHHVLPSSAVNEMLASS